MLLKWSLKLQHSMLQIDVLRKNITACLVEGTTSVFPLYSGRDERQADGHWMDDYFAAQDMSLLDTHFQGTHSLNSACHDTSFLDADNHDATHRNRNPSMASILVLRYSWMASFPACSYQDQTGNHNSSAAICFARPQDRVSSELSA